MKRLSFGSLIDPDVGIAAGCADVANVTQQMPLSILRTSLPETRANANKDYRCEFLAKTINGKPLNDLEPDAVNKRLAQCGQLGLQQGRMEVLGGQRGDVAAVRQECSR